MAPDRRRLAVIAAPGLIGALGLALHAPIPQDPAYHQFVDQRAWLGIPNLGNVLSNLPFLIVGLLALWRLSGRGGAPIVFADPRERAAYLLFFTGVALTCFGSGWYHLAPANGSLVWDRLPMGVAFMGLFAAVLAEHVSLRWSLRLLWPLAALGLFSVLWWAWTESLGRGDLRLYAWVQFYPMIAVVLVLSLLDSRYTRQRDWWGVVAWYVGAKLTEHFDAPIYDLLGVSGHSIKHLLAAGAAYWVLRMIERREVEGERLATEARRPRRDKTTAGLEP